MMNQAAGVTYGTISASGASILISPGSGEKPADTPSGLLATQAVQTQQGWLGQVIVDKDIIWQSPPLEGKGAAIDAANTHVVARLKTLFT